MPVTELNHYLIRANNLERTKDFYCKVLGGGLGHALVGAGAAQRLARKSKQIFPLLLHNRRF